MGCRQGHIVGRPAYGERQYIAQLVLAPPDAAEVPAFDPRPDEESADDQNRRNAEIDQQVHLGIDLASTRQADIKAANRGNVVFADYLGIYGNTIILDHGQGIFSLYSHLSQISVAVGELIDKGVVIGLSGNSGMAGGDHLHFSILVNGIFVTPLEWWDQQWLQLNIEDVLYGRKNR